MMILGLDIGSVISKAVLLDETLQVKDRWWCQSRGDAAGDVKFLIEPAIGKQVHRFARRKGKK